LTSTRLATSLSNQRIGVNALHLYCIVPAKIFGRDRKKRKLPGRV